MSFPALSFFACLLRRAARLKEGIPKARLRQKFLEYPAG
jgi:hypothetical protein